MNSIAKFFNLTMSTFVTILGCVCWINLCQYPTGTRCLVGKILVKLRPSCIVYTLCKTVVMDHLVDIQIFYANYSVFIYKFTALLIS